jgi:hypothetical protein
MRSGTLIASSSSVLTEQELDVNLSSVHPIDTLLVQQLEHILNSEKALRARYSSVQASSNTPEMRMAFAKELAELKDRADRLSRLINAMDFYGSDEDRRVTASFAPAVA